MVIIWLMHLIQLYDSVIYDVIMQIGGGLVGSFIVLWLVERKRKAKLKIEPLELSGALEPKELRQYLDQESGSIYVGFQVSNPKMGDFLALFFDREPAMSCCVYFQFDDALSEKRNDTGPKKKDGVKSYQDYSDKEGIPGRWNGAVAPQVDDPDRIPGKYHDFRFSFIQHEIDIPQGVTRTVYVAVQPYDKKESDNDKQDKKEDEYYLWNDRMSVYLGDQPYMDEYHYDLELKHSKHSGKIIIVTLGRTYEEDFELHIPNDQTVHKDRLSAIPGFRLELR